MKDLEIRGSGNLLGGEQSGHIAGVGFDLYVRLVGEAVADFRGESPEEFAEVKVDLPVDANLPVDYLPGERLRLEAYRALASATTRRGGRRGARRARRPVRRRSRRRSRTCSPSPGSRCCAGAYGVTEVSLQGNGRPVHPAASCPSRRSCGCERLYDRAHYKPAVATVSVPRPKGVAKPDGSFAEAKFGGEPLRDVALLGWCAQVLATVTGN